MSHFSHKFADEVLEAIEVDLRDKGSDAKVRFFLRQRFESDARKKWDPDKYWEEIVASKSPKLPVYVTIEHLRRSLGEGKTDPESFLHGAITLAKKNRLLVLHREIKKEDLGNSEPFYATEWRPAINALLQWISSAQNSGPLDATICRKKFLALEAQEEVLTSLLSRGEVEKGFSAEFSELHAILNEVAEVLKECALDVACVEYQRNQVRVNKRHSGGLDDPSSWSVPVELLEAFGAVIPKEEEEDELEEFLTRITSSSSPGRVLSESFIPLLWDQRTGVSLTAVGMQRLITLFCRDHGGNPTAELLQQRWKELEENRINHIYLSELRVRYKVLLEAPMTLVLLKSSPTSSLTFLPFPPNERYISETHPKKEEVALLDRLDLIGMRFLRASSAPQNRARRLSSGSQPMKFRGFNVLTARTAFKEAIGEPSGEKSEATSIGSIAQPSY